MAMARLTQDIAIVHDEEVSSFMDLCYLWSSRLSELSAPLRDELLAVAYDKSVVAFEAEFFPQDAKMVIHMNDYSRDLTLRLLSALI